jgi:acetyl-CoA synthetase
LKAVLARAALGDFSTLEDEASVDEIKATYEELRKQLDKK